MIYPCTAFLWVLKLLWRLVHRFCFKPSTHLYFCSFCILQIPPSHHISSANVNGSLSNHQEQTNRLSPEGTSSPFLYSPILYSPLHSLLSHFPKTTVFHGLPCPLSYGKYIDYLSEALFILPHTGRLQNLLTYQKWFGVSLV